MEVSESGKKEKMEEKRGDIGGLEENLGRNFANLPLPSVDILSNIEKEMETGILFTSRRPFCAEVIVHPVQLSVCVHACRHPSPVLATTLPHLSASTPTRTTTTSSLADPPHQPPLRKSHAHRLRVGIHQHCLEPVFLTTCMSSDTVNSRTLPSQPAS